MPSPDLLRLHEPVELASGRLRLRELTHDDAAFILELVNDPLWLRFIGDRNVHSLEEACGYVDRVRDGGYLKYGFGLWVVERAGTGEAAGLCGLIKRDTLELADVGFAFLERHRGHGFASEAVAFTLELARTRFGLERVCAITDLDNAASQRVLERAGFVFARETQSAEEGATLRLYERALADEAGSSPAGAGAFVRAREALASQFGAALDMLENAIRAASPRAWATEAEPVERRFWYVAFHTLFWLDYYLADSEPDFAPPPPFTLDETDPAGIYPARAYTPDELLRYLDHGRARLRSMLAALDDARAAAPCGFRRREGVNVFELQLYSLRHVQHHAGQLQWLLRQYDGAVPAWVGRSRN